MLPCNITLEEIPDGGTLVRIANPEVMILVGEWRQNPELNEIARQADERLKRVAETLRM